MSKIWLWITNLFPKSKLGVIFGTLFARAATSVVSDIMNPQNQKMAYQFAKELHIRKDLTTREKADIFNLKMLDWLQRLGKRATGSMINCLRELAVSVIKAEQDEETTDAV